MITTTTMILHCVRQLEADMRELADTMDARAAQRELEERDADMQYAVEHDRDDTGIRQRIYIARCDCVWVRGRGLQECERHKLMREVCDE